MGLTGLEESSIFPSHLDHGLPFDEEEHSTVKIGLPSLNTVCRRSH